MWGRKGQIHARRAGLVTLVGAALVVAAAGCGGSSPADAGRTLPPISTASQTASPDPTPTTTALTKKQELAAAEAVVRRYFAAFNSLRQRMDAGRLSALFTKDCGCQTQVRSVRSYARRGDRYTQHASIVAMTSRVTASKQVEVLVAFNETAGGVQGAKGSFISHSAAQREAQERFLVEQQGREWLIAEIRYLGG